ncbi:MAG: ABC transporter permease [Planctomycetes bacterium]|nr:ABC transporter permease [Planctomycetota bacterium]
MPRGWFGAAILSRELGSVARRGSNYALRACFVLFLALIVSVAWLEGRRGVGGGSYSELSRIGRGLFCALFVSEVFLVSLVAPLVTGGLIAGERQKKTLDLLFLTPMTALEIVLGKFLARMTFVAGLLLLAVPVLLGCLIFGGVGPEEILLGSLLVFLCGLWSGALGLFLSCLSVQPYLAVIATYFLLLLQTFGVLFGWLVLTQGRGAPSAWLFLTSPQLFAIARIVLSEELSFGGDPWPEMAGGTVAAVLLAVAAAVWFLRRTPGEPASAGAAPRGTKSRRKARAPRDWAAGCLSFLVGASVFLAGASMTVFAPWALARSHGMALLPLVGLSYVVLRAFLARRARPAQARRVWDNPVAWREVVTNRSWTVDRLVHLALLTLLFFMYVCLATERSAWGDRDFHGVYLGFELCVTLVVAIVLASVSMAQEAESGRLDLLVATTLAPSRILFGKFLGVAASVSPLVALLALHAAMSLAVRDRVEAAEALLALTVAGVFVFFHASLALVLGLRTRRVGVTIGVCLTLSLVVYLFCPILAGIVSRGDRSALFGFFLYLNPPCMVWGALCGGKDYVFRNGEIPFGFGIGMTILGHLGAGLGLYAWAVRRFERLTRSSG